MKFSTKALILFILTFSLKIYASPIPIGEWKYTILMNGNKTGEAVVKNKLINNNYISSTKMTMKIGAVTNISEEIVTETINFLPLKLESNSEITNNATIIKKDKTTAIVKGNLIVLDSGNINRELTLKNKFYFDGNFFLSQIINNRFRAGTIIKADFYIPAIEIEKPITMTVQIIGMKKININGEMKNLLHIKHNIEDIKNVDIYMSKKGIVYKTVLFMLNARIELIKN